MKAITMERSALKRLENVKEDHKKRLEALKSSQVSFNIISSLEISDNIIRNI